MTVHFDHCLSPLVVIYTDAEGEGGIGGVLVSKSQEAYFAATVPQCIRDLLLPRKTQIFLFEVIGVVASLLLWLSVLSGARLILFIDNIPALVSIQKGSSASDDANSVVGLAWQLVLSHCIAFRPLWVPSKLNLADPPSRKAVPIRGQAVSLRIRWESLSRALAAG